MALPGLLQTPEYARTIATVDGWSRPEAEPSLVVRRGRAEILTKPDPVILDVFIGEAALRESIGAGSVMHDQLTYLVEMSRKENVAIRVLPRNIGYHPGWLGPFVLYEFSDSSPVLYFEHWRGDVFVPDTDTVSAYRKAIDTLGEKAMSPDASTELITTLITEDAP